MGGLVKVELAHARRWNMVKTYLSVMGMAALVGCGDMEAMGPGADPPQKSDDVIVQAGHENAQNNCLEGLRGSTGAPREIEWTPGIAQCVVDNLKGRGIAARKVDATFNCAPEAKIDYPVVVAVHYQSTPPDESGYFVGVGDPNKDGVAAKSQALADAIRQTYGDTTGRPWRPNWNSENITGYYLFNALTKATPFALIECGTGNGPDKDFLWSDDGKQKVCGSIADGIARFLGR